MRRVPIAGRGVAPPVPADLEDRFPGRWDPRRAFHPDARLLVAAVTRALEQAGHGPGAAGGLVVGVDLAGLDEAWRLRQSIGRPAAVTPGDFLFILPSTLAAVVGLAVGLLDYQATIASGGRAGLDAVRHAAERLAGGAPGPLVAAALSRVSPEAARWLDLPAGELAVAWCLDAAAGPGSPGVLLDAPDGPVEDSARWLSDWPAALRGTAAAGLLALDRALDGPPGLRRLVHREALHGQSAVLAVEVSASSGSA